jgi:hypothetical protein
MKLYRATALSVTALLLVGCATDSAAAKRAPGIVARLQHECQTGNRASCTDMFRLQQECWGHASFSGINLEETRTCASAVRRIETMHPEIHS